MFCYIKLKPYPQVILLEKVTVHSLVLKIKHLVRKLTNSFKRLKFDEYRMNIMSTR